MERLKYIILGAGLAGLAVAYTLRDHGETSFLVLEKEEDPGGLCRSQEVDGKPLDIGGGHFLDLKRKEVLDLLFQFMPRSEWNEFVRLSKINLGGIEVDYPLEANLWQLPLQDQVDFLESIAQAGCLHGQPMPQSFEEWITWKLGSRIAHEYMLPYNRKIWSIDLSLLGTYWLHKLPNVSFRETLLSCLERRAGGSLPAHETFLYPKSFGFGEVWKRMGDALGSQLVTHEEVHHIDLHNKVINGRYKANRLITSIPWTAWPLVGQLPEEIQSAISQLRHSSIDISYNPATLSSKAHWIYDPDESKDHHRVLCRSNFCTGARGHWTETNSKRRRNSSDWSYHNEYAYPLNTRDKPAAIRKIIQWAHSLEIFPLGRWGTWEHMNSDVAVAEAIQLGKRLTRS